MRRVIGKARPGWKQTVAADGLIYNDTFIEGQRDPISYWREGPFYDFSTEEIIKLEADVATMFGMCVEAGDYIIQHDLFHKLAIPEWAVSEIIRSWEEEPPSVYGRFDLRYGGNSPLVQDDPTLAIPKLLEFNADTPTSLLEGSVTQWNWLLHTGQGKDQWNSLHERLIEAWRRNLSKVAANRGRKPLIHFAFTSAEESGEDQMNTQYMMETAHKAGFETKLIHIENIGHDLTDDRFFDSDGVPIEVIFKLYPWEWIFEESNGKSIVRNMRATDGTATLWIEPIYKALWSNKGILPVLWQLFKDDERSKFLLPAYFSNEVPDSLTSYVIKPLLGREGANVKIVHEGKTLADVSGEYGKEGHIVQAFAPLPNFNSEIDGPHHPVLGTWLVDGEPAGMGIRESDGLVTDNLSFFAPHTIDSPL